MTNIINMRLHTGYGNQVAKFDVEIDGWTIREACIVQRPDGALAVLPPIIRNGIRAVSIPDRHWRDFIIAAMGEYKALRRATPELSVDVDEALQMAGI